MGSASMSARSPIERGPLPERSTPTSGSGCLSCEQGGFGQRWRQCYLCGFRKHVGGPVPPFDDAELAFVGLDNRGAAFNPVAAVQVVNAAEGAVRGMVDVAANNPIDGASP